MERASHGSRRRRSAKCAAAAQRAGRDGAGGGGVFVGQRSDAGSLYSRGEAVEASERCGAR